MKRSALPKAIELNVIGEVSNRGCRKNSVCLFPSAGPNVRCVVRLMVIMVYFIFGQHCILKHVYVSN